MLKQAVRMAFGVVVALAGLGGPTDALGAELVVVLHPLNPTTELTERKLRKLFIGTLRYWDADVSVIPYVRPEGTGAGDLLMEVCKMSRQRYESMWTRKQLAGEGVQPRQLDALDDVVSAVAADPRAVTVVTAEEADRIDSVTVRLVVVPLE
jgi:hypothetical protein